jgi:hypothetical protein
MPTRKQLSGAMVIQEVDPVTEDDLRHREKIK